MSLDVAIKQGVIQELMVKVSCTYTVCEYIEYNTSFMF